MKPEELMRELDEYQSVQMAGVMANTGLKPVLQASEPTHADLDRRLSHEEKEFIDNLLKCLPPIIARKAVPHYLGGLLSQQTLAMADSAGLGPEIAYRIGRNIAYKTDSLVRWLVGRYGVKRLVNIKNI